MGSGRRPTPTAVKLTRGNPGHRPINQHEPKHATLDRDDVPGELDGDELARAEWFRLVDTLARGHVTSVDRSTFAAYCKTYSDWRKYSTAAALEPPVLKSRNGFPLANPAIGLAGRALVLMVKLAAELGITPSSRSRIAAAPFEEPAANARDVDEFTQYQRQRKGHK